MTEQLQKRDEPKYLAAGPQPLGILPTWWFWNDKANWKLVRVPFAALTGLVVAVVALVDLPAVAAGAIAAGGVTLALGALERHVRRRLRDKHETLSE